PDALGGPHRVVDDPDAAGAVEHRETAGALDGRENLTRAGDLPEALDDVLDRLPRDRLDGAQPLGEACLVVEARDGVDADVEESLQDLDGAEVERAADGHADDVAAGRRRAERRVAAAPAGGAA